MASQYITDLNCDMGESYGTWNLGNDEAIMRYISSVNIACGFHAGDPTTMKKTVKLALEHGVAIGAHPGLPDLQGFGRREMNITAEEAYDMVIYQIGALAAIVKAEGGVLHHVKPHGALYNMAAVKTELADAIALAVHRADEQLVLYGLSGSELIRSGQKRGLKVFSEVFADRTYQQDGTLTSRKLPGALITDHQESLKQVLKMVKEGKVITQQGNEVPIQADTICIHGDGATALEFAEKIYHRFKEEGIRIK